MFLCSITASKHMHSGTISPFSAYFYLNGLNIALITKSRLPSHCKSNNEYGKISITKNYYWLGITYMYHIIGSFCVSKAEYVHVSTISGNSNHRQYISPKLFPCSKPVLLICVSLWDTIWSYLTCSSWGGCGGGWSDEVVFSST